MTLQVRVNNVDMKMSLTTTLHAHITAILVQFLVNTTTASEDDVVKLDIQYLLQPPNVTLQEPVIITVAVVNDSATGRLQVLLHSILLH